MKGKRKEKWKRRGGRKVEGYFSQKDGNEEKKEQRKKEKQISTKREWKKAKKKKKRARKVPVGSYERLEEAGSLYIFFPWEPKVSRTQT